MRRSTLSGRIIVALGIFIGLSCHMWQFFWSRLLVTKSPRFYNNSPGDCTEAYQATIACSMEYFYIYLFYPREDRSRKSDKSEKAGKARFRALCF